MSGFEEKLNAILGNQEAMGQIMALAQSLGKQEETTSQQSGQEEEDGYTPVWTQAEEHTDAQPIPDLASVLGGVDPQMMQMGMRLLQEYNRTDDRNTALLAALRPFVKAERFSKVDRAVQIARLSRVIRVLFDAMQEKGGGGLV